MPNTPLHTRRFLFHGHAAAIGGRIVREGEGANAKPVEDGFIDFPGSSLTVVGGRSSATLSPDQITHPVVKKFVRFKTANSTATGEYDDPKKYFSASQKRVDRGTLKTTTKVRTEVLGLDVGLDGQPRMHVDGVRGGFTSRSSAEGVETPVRLDADTGFDGDRITFFDKDKAYTLKVQMDLRAFNAHPTLSALLEASKGVDFARKFGASLFLGAPRSAAKGKSLKRGAAKTFLPPARPKLERTDSGAVVGTIVRSLTWEGEPFPGSEFDEKRPNRVRIPGLGTLSLGEIVVDKQARRITMIRGDLGSDIGAELAVCDYQDNGGFA